MPLPMRNLFLPNVDLAQSSLTIDGPDGHHLVTVLRVRAGEHITVLDNCGLAAETEVVEVDKRTISLHVLGPVTVAPEPAIRITVAQALGKGDKFDQVIQHGTEVSASAFIPLVTERTVVKLDASSGEEKLKRLQAIAKGAAEQSGRARIPAIEHSRYLADMAREVKDFDRVFILDPAGEALHTVLNRSQRCEITPKYLLMVGPEGGFSPSEIAIVKSAGGFAVSLGDHILRTETAALVAIAQILFAHRAGLLPEGMA